MTRTRITTTAHYDVTAGALDWLTAEAEAIAVTALHPEPGDRILIELDASRLVTLAGRPVAWSAHVTARVLGFGEDPGQHATITTVTAPHRTEANA